ncbi:phage tail tape measure protein [Streptomyces sp. NPDC059783]|uniref:phage tail tape measure protein n=1 Tax=Streptomyces sp. NPDC059783 TaxID=3346944 RepID=UPI00365219AA
MADTSLVFNLVARDRASGAVSAMGEKFKTAAAGIGVGFAAVLGASVMQSMDMEAAGDKLAAQLGLGPAEAAEVAQVSASVYSNAWGESIDEVNLAVKGVYQNIGDVSQAEDGLEGVTTKVMALAQTFDQDLTMATAAAGQMVRTGLADNADEALDILTVGLGGAADKAGDLLETFNEYSTQFRRVGLDAQTVTGLLSQGLKAGAKDADQVADAIGQFGERALAGGSAIDDAFKSIGLSSKDMAKKIGAGGATAEGALTATLKALRGTKSEQVKLNAAAALFGDPGNVLGEALFALDPATAVAAAGMSKASGAASRMAEQVGDNPKMAIERFKRTVLTDLGEIGGVVAKFAMQNQGAIAPLMKGFAALAATVLLVRGAMAVYAAVSAVVTAANVVLSASVWTVMANWTRMMVIGLAAYARIAASAVVSAATTAAAWVGSALVSMGLWLAAVIRAGVTAAAQFLMMAARAVAWATVMAAQWLIAMGPVGWVIAAVVALAVAIIANWDKIRAASAAVWNWLWGKVKAVGSAILGFFLKWNLVAIFLRHWDRIKSGVTSKATQMIVFVATLPGRIARAIGNVGNLLYSKGVAIVRGLWNGIKAMGGWLRSTLIGWAKNLIPGPIAKALGIHSPSRVMATVVGRWIPAGVVEGIEDGQGILDRTMATLVQPPSSAQAAGVGRQMGSATAAPIMTSGQGTTIRIELAGPEEIKRLLRGIVRKDGRGNVQVAFGTGR